MVSPSSLLSCATLGCDLCLLFPCRGVFLMSQKRGLNCVHAPGERCQGEEWSYSFCCWVENGENTCLSAIFCSAITCFSELLQGATFCCFSPLCFFWQLPKCCIKTASGELCWHGHPPPCWCWFKCSEKKPGQKSDWNCLVSHENHWERGQEQFQKGLFGTEASSWLERKWKRSVFRDLSNSNKTQAPSRVL